VSAKVFLLLYTQGLVILVSVRESEEDSGVWLGVLCNFENLILNLFRVSVEFIVIIAIFREKYGIN